MTREELDEILKRIADTGGATPDMLDDMQKIRDSWDEREGMLNRDESDSEERRDDERGADELGSDDREDWKGKYEDLWGKYKERFFSGVGEGEAMTKQEKDIKEDEESDLDYDDLFKERGQKGDTAD